MFVSPRSKLGFSDGAYLSRICPIRAIDASFLLTVELLTYAVEITPSTFAPAAAADRKKSRFAETLLRSICGVQPTFAAVTIAVIVGEGVAKMTNTSAPLL